MTARHAEPLAVLLHSPLVGPGSWMPLARELERRGRRAIVPSLAGIADAPAPHWPHCPAAVRAATEDIRDPLLLVGHSAAGVLLPAIADAVRGEVAGFLFVDAFLPPASGTTSLAPPAFVPQLRALASDGLLPPWSTWFGPRGIEHLVPDERVRARLEDEMPRLPLACLEASIPVPDGWDRAACAYLLLSPDTHADTAAEARGRGWPVAEVDGGHHLAAVTAPAAVTDALLDLERRLGYGL